MAGVFSHLTLEDSLEQPFLRRFWRVTSVQVWREGTVRSKHVQLFKAFCFYHLEKVQRHGRCEGLWPSPRVKRNPAPSLGLSPTGTQSQQVLPPPRPLPGGPACCPPPKPHPVSSFTPSGPRSPRQGPGHPACSASSPFLRTPAPPPPSPVISNSFDPVLRPPTQFHLCLWPLFLSLLSQPNFLRVIQTGCVCPGSPADPTAHAALSRR